MERAETKLARAGERVRKALTAETCAADDLRSVRAGLLERVAARNVGGTGQRCSFRSTARGWLALLAFGAGAAGVVFIWGWMRLPVSFQVGKAGAPGRLGDPIEAMEDEPTPLRFSEGSSLLLHQGSQIRVLSSDAKGSRVLVENGVVDASIARGPVGKSHWRFEAGSFHVLVTGTKFKMEFNSQDQSLRISTHEGQVVVSAACLKMPKTVGAGNTFDLVCRGEDVPMPPTDHGV
jgi:transmembrane sensor